ncbi:MAG: LacI family DNA-binding transcriptional regulator [Clostridia bacterium]|nr:LacI family DNA-binding transcriptional regulator [Clostridia bacterium]
MATLKDVAERAGVTVTTVSRMLNNKVCVSEKTRSRIQAAMNELGYHPNDFARSLSKKSSNFIGLIVPMADHAFFNSVIASVERHASERGLKLLLCVSNHAFEKEKEFIHMLLSNKVQGIILASHTEGIDEFESIDAPLITLDRIVNTRIPAVCADNYHGGKLAGRHLIERGCQKLVYISDTPIPYMEASKRYLGFCDACAQAGVDRPPEVIAADNQFCQMDYHKTIEKVFAEHPDVDGIFTSNDIIAAQVIQYCHKHQIAIPDQLKLVGYDNSQLASMCSPPLTAIHQPIDDICNYAVASIVQASKGYLNPSQAVFPVTLVERETT